MLLGPGTPLRRINIIEKVQPLASTLEAILGKPVEIPPTLSRNFRIQGDGLYLYLRYNDYSGRFVVANIEVHPKGQGLGTRICKAMMAFARQNGFSEFVLESVVSEEGERLAKKLGMVPDPRYPGNWIVHLW